MNIQNFSIPGGTFGDGIIPSSLHVPRNHNGILCVNLPGVCTEIGGLRGQYKKTIHGFSSEEGVASVMHQGSIDPDFDQLQIDPLIGGNYKYFKENALKTDGKTFMDGVHDVETMLDYYRENSMELFGRKWEDMTLWLNGNSNGGTEGYVVAGRNSDVAYTSCNDTGLRTKQGKGSVLGSLPIDDLPGYLESGKQGIIMTRAGPDDPIFKEEDYQGIYTHAGDRVLADRTMGGADHHFQDSRGKADPNLYPMVFRNNMKVVTGK